MAQLEIRARIVSLGFDVVGNTPQDFGKEVQEEVTRWAKVIKAANIKVE